MFVSTADLMLCTLPKTSKLAGVKLIENARQEEQKRLTQNASSKFRRHSKKRSPEDVQGNKIEIHRKANKGAEPLAIAKLIMEVWSPCMRCHAESVILNKAMQLDYLKESHLKWVTIIDNCNIEVLCDDNNWVVDDQDEVIIELVWNRFNMKQHFEDTRLHRLWIQRSYDRLKAFIPQLLPEVIERHDLTKFAFSQAVGYTLKWVHNINSDIWRAACDLHLYHEPHHPQVWRNTHTPEEKKMKLECWLTDVCDFKNRCPYGIDLCSLDLKSENFPETFLMESFIDMVAVEWERKKGQRLNISTRELVYMDDKFLQRYTPSQYKIIQNLIEIIISVDQSWTSVVLSDRERRLLSTVPENRYPVIVGQLENQKKSEVARQVKIEGGSPFLSSKPSKEMIQRGEDIAYFITVCRVVTEVWNSKYRNYAEKVILKRAVEEDYIKQEYLKWVSIFNPTIDNDNDDEIMIDENLIVQILWHDFMLDHHFSAVKAHRYWVKQSYLRLSQFMKEVPEEVIDRHDLTKLAISQSLGYTLKWIHNINYTIWRKACNMHLHHEPHHPEMWSKKLDAKDKELCLHKWLCIGNGGNTYGVNINRLDLKSENMVKIFLMESLLDMVAVEWERNKGQRPDLTNTELIYMEDRFLARYTPADKAFILEMMSIIRQTDTLTAKTTKLNIGKGNY